jgi:hypothetical protein
MRKCPQIIVKNFTSSNKYLIFSLIGIDPCLRFLRGSGFLGDYECLLWETRLEGKEKKIVR